MKTSSQVFYFTVRHLRWLARVPGLPQLFDALLLAWTCVAHRQRLAAMEQLESDALRLPGVGLKVHRFGGVEFALGLTREIGHMHGHGLLDVMIGAAHAELLIASGQVRPHHVFLHSSWISYQLESGADVPFALELLSTALIRLEVSTDPKRA